MSRARKLVLVLGLGLTVNLMTTMPAGAVPPEKTVFIDQGFAVLPDIDCGTFVLHEELVSERIQDILFFDKAGNPIRLQETINFTGVITNSATGQTFRDTLIGMDVFDLTNGEAAFNGPAFKLHETGEGLIFSDIGRKVFDADGNLVFSAGPDDFVQAGFDLTALCAVLA